MGPGPYARPCPESIHARQVRARREMLDADMQARRPRVASIDGSHPIVRAYDLSASQRPRRVRHGLRARARDRSFRYASSATNRARYDDDDDDDADDSTPPARRASVSSVSPVHHRDGTTKIRYQDRKDVRTVEDKGDMHKHMHPDGSGVHRNRFKTPPFFDPGVGSPTVQHARRQVSSSPTDSEMQHIVGRVSWVT
jgi:hypothetical protein